MKQQIKEAINKLKKATEKVEESKEQLKLAYFSDTSKSVLSDMDDRMGEITAVNNKLYNIISEVCTNIENLNIKIENKKISLMDLRNELNSL